MIGLPWQTLRLSLGEDAVLQEGGCQQGTVEALQVARSGGSPRAPHMWAGKGLW